MSDPHFEPRPEASGPAPLVLGTMNFGKRTPRDVSLRILARAADAGVTLLDTANVYNDGASEQIVGAFLRGRAGVQVATKVGFARVNGRPEGLSRAAILAACEASLTRLGVDAIDLYYLHVPDPLTPPEATLEAVAGLLAAGKIRHWGVSNYASWQILHWKHLAAEAGIPGPVVAQQLYNPLIRQLDVEYFAFAQSFPIHTTIYNPLAGGLLAGFHKADAEPGRGSRFDNNPMYRRRYWRPAMFAAVEPLRAVAASEGLSLLALAYAFVLRHPGVDSVLVGPATADHLDAALVAVDVTLSDAATRAVRDVYVDLVGTDASYAR